MNHDKLNRYFRSWLPAYLNGNLTGLRGWLVRRWARDPRRQGELAGLRHVQSAMRETDADLVPRAEVWQGILAQIRETPAVVSRPARPTIWATGMLVMAAVLTLVWFALPPGIVLQWSVQGDAPEAFRVYRAPQTGAADAATLDFALLEQVPANAAEGAYRFMDVQLVPGQSFVYRVEAVGENGQALASQVVVGNALEALPGQLAILLSGLVMIYGIYAVTRPQKPGLRLGTGLLGGV